MTTLKKALKPVFEFCSQMECKIAKSWVRGAHKRLMKIQWNIAPQPEHFDHEVDLYYQWQEKGSPFWLERGILGNFAVQHLLSKRTGKLKILDFCCGDGFYSKNIYSYAADEILAVDFDPAALKTANKKNNLPNITYVQADIREIELTEKYDIIIWDAAFEHFTMEELTLVIKKIKAALKEDGILSSYTIKRRASGKMLEHHEYEPVSKEDFKSFFVEYFKNIESFETNYPGRDNLYLIASDSTLPFKGN